MPPMSKPTTCFDGDAAKALALVDELRRRGAPLLSVKVGEVAIELAHVERAGGVNVPTPTRKSVVQEWGGEAFAKALEGDEDAPVIPDDDDQPAVMS